MTVDGMLPEPQESRVLPDDIGPLPQIDAGIQDLKVITGLAWSALLEMNKPERLFRRAGKPQRIETDDEGVTGQVIHPGVGKQFTHPEGKIFTHH